MSSSKSTSQQTDAEIQPCAPRPGPSAYPTRASHGTKIIVQESTTRFREIDLADGPREVSAPELPPAPHRPRTLSVSMNPLAEMTEAQVLRDVDVFVERHGLRFARAAFRKGSLAALTQHIPSGFERMTQLSVEDKMLLRYEDRNIWQSNPLQLYLLCGLCAGCAIVQGADQTVINGAQVSHSKPPIHPLHPMLTKCRRTTSKNSTSLILC